MSISQRTLLPFDMKREAGSNVDAQSAVEVEDAAQSGPDDPTTEPNGSNGRAPETIPLPGSAHRPLAYPAWPTSKPGPRATLPLPGQHPHPRRTDQMVYFCYDQERGMPGVSPPGPVVVQKQRGRTYLSDERAQEAASDGKRH